jgi:hypothetical protein
MVGFVWPLRVETVTFLYENNCTNQRKVIECGSDSKRARRPSLAADPRKQKLWLAKYVNGTSDTRFRQNLSPATPALLYAYGHTDNKRQWCIKSRAQILGTINLEFRPRNRVSWLRCFTIILFRKREWTSKRSTSHSSQTVIFTV